METLVAIVLALGFAGGISYWIAILYNAARVQREIQNVKTTPIEANDDESTKAKFRELLGEARYSMVIYDDGDKVPDSIYMDEGITKLVRQKLDANPDFRMQCLFNCDEPDLLFRNAFIDYASRVEIKTRDQTKPRLAIHYKIIDGGVKAYLSRHRPGSSQRRFRIVDCTDVSESNRNRVSNAVLGTYKKDFHRAFKAARVAA